MNPQISKISQSNTHYDEFSFTISNINKCFVNALRRVCLTDIDTTVITEINIEENSSRLINNEVLKHSISCIPVFATGIQKEEMQEWCERYELVLKKVNTSAHIMHVTSGDFQIRDKKTGSFLIEEQRNLHFPADPFTKDHILFMILRPHIGKLDDDDEDDEDDEDGGKEMKKKAFQYEGERISLTAQFSLSCSRENAIYNVVETCYFVNSVNEDEIEQEWMRRSEKMQYIASITAEEIEFAKQNFLLLDANRSIIPNSFDFTIQSLGVFSNRNILQKALHFLVQKLNRLEEEELNRNYVNMIEESLTTMENCYDVLFVNEDYTLLEILNFLIHETYDHIGRKQNDVESNVEKILSYCSYIVNAHSKSSILRIGFYHETTKEDVLKILKEVFGLAKEVLAKMYHLFD